MDGYGIQWSRRRQWNFLKDLRRLKDASLARRYLIVYHSLQGASPTAVARMVVCDRSTVYRILWRFALFDEAGLLDRRQQNGQRKVDEDFLRRLREVVRATPPDFGWRRPTWTRELLIKQMVRETGVRVSPATMSRALKAIKARHGRPRPVVRCPWSNWRRNRRLRAIRGVLAHLSPKEAAFYADEADIDLNPKIGPDWMLKGQQKEVVTPGQNVKRYVAGALDGRTGRLTWVFAERKTSALFVSLLEKLCEVYPEAHVIHVIVDNARQHNSRITDRAVEAMGGRVVLHFLPPYCPNENRIERVWRDVHDNVTRNHQCDTIEALVRHVYYYLYNRNRRLTRKDVGHSLQRQRRAA
jgi:transposase